MIENVEEYKEKENALKAIEKRLEIISKSQEEIDIGEVKALRDEAKIIATDMQKFINQTFS